MREGGREKERYGMGRKDETNRNERNTEGKVLGIAKDRGRRLVSCCS